MTTREILTQDEVEAISDTVFDIIEKNGAQGVSAILAALITVARETESAVFLVSLLDMTKDMLIDRSD